MFPEPRRASALVYHQVTRVLWLVLQRVHCHVWVVRHLRNYQQGCAEGEPTWPGLACPHLHYHPLLTVREYVAEEVQEGRRWVVCCPLCGEG